MTAWKRIRLFLGVIAVTAIVAGLLLYLNASMSRVSSESAKLLADTYTVGTDYSGTVIEQYVQIGDQITAGERLFSISSTVFRNDLATNEVDRNSLAFEIDENNNIILTATGDGTITDIVFQQGAFVPANKEIATIAKSNSLYVEAHYALTPPDYARIKKGNIVYVTLPNNQQVQGNVFFTTTRSKNDRVITVVRARLVGVELQQNFTVGTPVTAKLQLTGKTLATSIKESATNLLKPKG